jgi:hypothetical protein
MARVAKIICHILALIIAASTSPTTIAGSSDKNAARVEERRIERDARNAKKQADADERRQQRQEREAHRNARADEQLRDARNRARDEERKRDRSSPMVRDNHRTQEVTRSSPSSLRSTDGVRYTREPSVTQRQGQVVDDNDRQEELARIKREVDRISNSPSFKRLKEFTPEEVAALKRQGREKELDRYVDRGGRKPTVEGTGQRDSGSGTQGDRAALSNADRKLPSAVSGKNEQEKLGEASRDTQKGGVKPQSTALERENHRGVPEAAARRTEIFNAEKKHWEIVSVPPPPKATPAIPTVRPVQPAEPSIGPKFVPQPEKYGGSRHVSEVLTSRTDKDWYAGLSVPQRAAVGKYSGDQLNHIQRLGQWEQFKQEIASGRVTPSTTESTPSREALGKMSIQDLAKLTPEQLRNLDENRARSLSNYKQGLTDAERYGKEAGYWNNKADRIERGLDAAQVAIGVAGQVPIVGNAADLTNAAISAARGDKAGAALDIAAATPVPGVGTAAGAASVVRRVEKTADLLDPIEKHHLLPKQFKLQFERAGLDIEQFKLDMPRSAHRQRPNGLHTGSGLERWNENWRQFFLENPVATREQILTYLGSLRAKFEID